MIISPPDSLVTQKMTPFMTISPRIATRKFVLLPVFVAFLTSFSLDQYTSRHHGNVQLLVWLAKHCPSKWRFCWICAFIEWERCQLCHQSPPLVPREPWHGRETNASTCWQLCRAKNKNSFVMWYLLWRVLSGWHVSNTMCFLFTRHTKFSCDWCFGLMKRT